jgi:hypothetical protein
VSKVTDEYALDGAAGTAFTLVNILENKAECAQSFDALSSDADGSGATTEVDPCKSLDYSVASFPSVQGVNAIFAADTSGLTRDVAFYGPTAPVDLFRLDAATGEVLTVFAGQVEGGYKSRRLVMDPSGTGKYVCLYCWWKPRKDPACLWKGPSIESIQHHARSCVDILAPQTVLPPFPCVAYMYQVLDAGLTWTRRRTSCGPSTRRRGALRWSTPSRFGD